MYIDEDIIWLIQNTALTFFFLRYMRLVCTCFLNKKYEWRVVIRRSCSILARQHERICHSGKSNFSHVTGGLITATIPVHVGKTFTHSSDFTLTKRKNISRFTSIDRFFILMESDSSIEFSGAIRLALIVWPPKYNNTQQQRPSTAQSNKVTSIGSFTYAENVLYMLFFVSCSIHSLKKSQQETKRVGDKRKSVQLQ